MLLGFIPGVGAMYNGQFMKGFIHVVIFVMLIVATANISGLFGILIGFFVIYMAFDAYKTAQAKTLGLPLPDPLGLDRLFGLQETHYKPTATAATEMPPAFSGIPGEVSSGQGTRSNSSPVGAIVLIALGVVFLLENVIRISLHRYWPLILIGVGLWLAYKRLATGPREAR